MSGMVESVGSIGLDNHRSGRRSVYTLGSELTPREIWRSAVRLRWGAQENDNTRAQLKFLGRLEDIPPSARHLVDAVFTPTVDSSEHPTQSGVIFMSANAKGRRDPTLQAQWDAARAKWQKPLHITPRKRLSNILAQGYTTDTNIRPNDIPNLHQLWGPFGWPLEGVQHFYKVYDSHDPSKAGYFACIRDREGKIVAAGKAEMLRITDKNLIEETELATLPGVQQQGLGSGVAIALVEQAAQNLPDGSTIIMGEGNLSSDNPGSLALRNAGFTPAGADMNSPVPNGVLAAHVSIYGSLASFLPVQITPEDWAMYYSS